METNNPMRRSNGRLAFLERPLTGPLVIGSILGGVPLAIAFSRLGGRLVSPEFLRYGLDLTPLAIIVTTIGTLWTTDHSWKKFIFGALATSFFACVPLPLVISCILMARFGHDVFSLSSLPVLAGILLIWSLVVALSSWLLSLGLAFLFHRNKKNSLRDGTTVI